jgi:DNA replication protein DnaC
MRIVGYRMRLTQAHIDRMRIPQRFWFVGRREIIPEVREIVDKYIKNLDENLDVGEGLLMWGTNGTGKTSAAVFIGLEVRRRGATVFFVQAERLRASVLEKEMFDDEQTVMERARAVDFLILDDLGKEHPGETGFSERLFENLLRERSATKKTTIVTTNLSVDKLKETYVRSMLEVMRETLYPLCFEGENLREAVEADLRARHSVSLTG